MLVQNPVQIRESLLNQVTQGRSTSGVLPLIAHIADGSSVQ